MPTAPIPSSKPLRRTLQALAILLGSAAGSAQAFDRVNVLVTHVPVPAQPRQGLAGAPRYARLECHYPGSIAVLGDSLLFLDPQRHRILRLREGRITVFAGTGASGGRIDPDDPLRTELSLPQALGVLRDQSVLVAHTTWNQQGRPTGEVILRIRTRPREGEPTVSLFAGNGQRRGPVPPGGSALDAPLYYPHFITQERDGAVLLANSEGYQVLRVRTDGTVGVVAGTGVRGDHLDPASGPDTQLGYIFGLAVLEDGSVLIAEHAQRSSVLRVRDVAGRVLRVRDGAVTVYAGTAQGAEHPLGSLDPTALTCLPDGSVVLLDHARTLNDKFLYRLVHLTAGGVSLLAGEDLGDLPLDPQHCPGLRIESGTSFEGSLTALRDGSLVFGLDLQGIRLLSPPDALQARLEALVDQGKAAVRAEDLAAYRRAAHDLAFLCAPGSPALGAVNHAAHDQGRLAPGGLAARLHLIPELMKVVQHQAGPDDPERLRAQLALRELRRYKKEWLGHEQP